MSVSRDGSGASASILRGDVHVRENEAIGRNDRSPFFLFGCAGRRVYTVSMNKSAIIGIGFAVCVLLAAVGFLLSGGRGTEESGCTMEAKICPDGSAVGRSGPSCEFAPCHFSEAPNDTDRPGETMPGQEGITDTFVPLDRAGERVTAKPFGILIMPETSPIRPERFRGYHTGTDFEIFSDEVGIDVPVRAVCDGAIVAKRRADGYGGVVVERCELGGEAVTVIYGHLALSGVDAAIGDRITTGDTIGFLGAAGSADTDGERKHLHLGIRRGATTDIRGYVADEEMLSGWLDPCTFFCR